MLNTILGTSVLYQTCPHLQKTNPQREILISCIFKSQLSIRAQHKDKDTKESESAEVSYFENSSFSK